MSLRVTDQKPFIVGEVWFRPGVVSTRPLTCGLCMHQFVLGETARWQYVEGAPNTFVCVDCDGLDVAERFKDRWVNVIRPILRYWCEDYR